LFKTNGNGEKLFKKQNQWRKGRKLAQLRKLVWHFIYLFIFDV
jgi:hypothetical protein